MNLLILIFFVMIVVNGEKSSLRIFNSLENKQEIKMGNQVYPKYTMTKDDDIIEIDWQQAFQIQRDASSSVFSEKSRDDVLDKIGRDCYGNWPFPRDWTNCVNPSSAGTQLFRRTYAPSGFTEAVWTNSGWTQDWWPKTYFFCWISYWDWTSDINWVDHNKRPTDKQDGTRWFVPGRDDYRGCPIERLNIDKHPSDPEYVYTGPCAKTSEFLWHEGDGSSVSGRIVKILNDKGDYCWVASTSHFSKLGLVGREASKNNGLPKFGEFKGTCQV